MCGILKLLLLQLLLSYTYTKSSVENRLKNMKHYRQKGTFLYFPTYIGRD